ncbi:HAD-IA family hydrolase [Pseudactinotalea sp. HY160]|uniref:HAD family hydrolase n=1 Tax=Pseudactinotalea sp. HY160 TaxID=2654490 RepID=UPI00130FBC26|nr:HAD-IA family hydrolase [Pseudactinotalea sp. HY160]
MSRAVVFDLDDTLVDTRTAFAAAIDAATRLLDPDLTPERSAVALASWRQDLGGHYRAYTRGTVGYWEQREARLREIGRALGLPGLGADDVEAWNEAFDLAFAGAWAPFPDARPTVDRLREAGYEIGVVTNAQTRVQELKLAATGLDDLPLLVTMDTFGVGKPAPEVFLEACRRLGVEPGETTYVGDELDTDARGAMNAGLRGMWLARPGRRRGGHHDEDPEGARASGVAVLTSLTELPDLLGAL